MFINHTGPKQNQAAGRFAANLAKRMQLAGIDTFIDFKSLHKGEPWRPRLQAAAANSRMFVAVVCKEYACRFWPMLELDLAMQRWDKHQRTQAAGSGQQGTSPTHILPVLYERLSEADVRKVARHWNNKRVLAALSEEERLQVDAERWASNLTRLCGDLQAFRTVSYCGKGSEVELQDDIVARVHEVLPPLFAMPAAIFGGHLQAVLKLLEAPGASRAGACGVWLHGLGEGRVVWATGHEARAALHCGSALRLCITSQPPSAVRSRLRIAGCCRSPVLTMAPVSLSQQLCTRATRRRRRQEHHR